MKKIALYLSILVSIAFIGSCDQLNNYPEFDDADAFVAFGSERMSVKEDGDSLLVPVRLTSLGAKTSTVTFEIIDSTAVRGVDFELRGGASVLTFDGSKAVLNIEFDILPQTGVFTGDLIFGVIIKSATGVNIGSNDTTFITINDIDHPLAEILGEYVGSGDDAWGGGVYSWSDVVFEKDPSDVTKIWIINVFSGYAAPIAVYGVVNDEKTEISVPVHQSVGKEGKVGSYKGYFDGAEIPFAMMSEGEKLTFTINNGVVAIQGEYQAGVGAYDATTGDFLGWFERVSDLTFTKK